MKWFLTMFCLFFFIGAANAQQQTCNASAIIEQVLKETYGEKIVGRGLINETRRLEIYVNPNTRTFTVTIKSVLGISCIYFTGKTFQINNEFLRWHSNDVKAYNDGRTLPPG